MWGTWVRSLGQEVPLEKAVAPYSSILAWKIPWTEEPGRLQVHGVAKSWTRLSGEGGAQVDAEDKAPAQVAACLQGWERQRLGLCWGERRGLMQTELEGFLFLRVMRSH